MKYSAFAKYGHLRFSSRPSHGEVIYRQLLNALGGQYSTEIGSRAEAWAYATAMRLATVRYTKERGANQTDPRLVVEMLPVREVEYGLVPGSRATIQDRQAELTRKTLLPQGARETAVSAALAAAIGTNFLFYRVTKPSELVSFPASPGAGPANWVRIGTVSKVIRLTGSIAVTGTPFTVGFAPANPEENIALTVGDKLVVSANNIGLGERVTVTAASANTFTATFTKAHDVGDICTTGYFPYWISNQGHVFVLVTPAAALDSEMRRKINTTMEEIMRSFVAWEIAPSSDGLDADLLTTDDPLLGRTGYAMTGPALAFP